MQRINNKLKVCKLFLEYFITYLEGNYFGHRARFPSSLKHFLGLGMLDQNRLDKEMHTFHSEKLVETFDAVTAGRIKKRRRRTRARELSLLELLTAFENHKGELQIQNLHFHLLELGTMSCTAVN